MAKLGGSTPRSISSAELSSFISDQLARNAISLFDFQKCLSDMFSNRTEEEHDLIIRIQSIDRIHQEISDLSKILLLISKNQKEKNLIYARSVDECMSLVDLKVSLLKLDRKADEFNDVEFF